MKEGRTMSRQKITISILMILIIGFSFIMPAPAKAAGSITELWDGHANGINARGQVVGQDINSGAAVMWNKGKITTLWENGAANAINARGQVVGKDINSGAAVMWYKGEVTTLWENGKAKAINNKGQVAGISEVHWKSLIWYIPIIWHEGELTQLGLVKTGADSPVGINNRGQVVGALNTPIGWLWDEPVLQTLPFWACDINNRGQVVGYKTTSGEALIWDEGEVTVLWQGTAHAINNRGQVVGQDAASGDAVMWYKGEITTLWENGAAKAINERGQVAGEVYKGSNHKAVLWEKR
jgi:uncharacterized membrane protein